MARTVASILTEAREHLQDTLAPYRYSDSSLLELLNSALREARTLRPDYFVGNTLLQPITRATTDGNFPADEQLEVPVVYYIVGAAQLRDDEFAEDSRALGMLNTFRQSISGVKVRSR